jgi:hypothetical protein
VSDGGRRRQFRRPQRAANAACTTHAETPVAFVVAFAGGDRVQVIPDPQRVRVVACGQPGLQARVRLLGGAFDVAVAGIGHVEGAELQVAVLAPGDAVATTVMDLVVHPPAFEWRVATHRQVHPQVARVAVHGRGLVAETEYGQQPGVGQHGVQRIVPVLHGERGGSMRQGLGK